jgi:hypothetical protein
MDGPASVPALMVVSPRFSVSCETFRGSQIFRGERCDETGVVWCVVEAYYVRTVL